MYTLKSIEFESKLNDILKLNDNSNMGDALEIKVGIKRKHEEINPQRQIILNLNDILEHLEQGELPEP